MAENLTYAGELVIRTCWCGLRFAIPSELSAEYERKDGKMSLRCPLGHSMVPGCNEIKQLKARLASARESRDLYREQRDYAERQARAHKGHHTRTKNRIANGVCPCCNRTFVNLGKHMKSQHPNFVSPTEGSK